MTAEIIVEFPTPLTEKEKRMIYGYKGELIRCKDCQFYQTDKGGWCLDHDDDVLWLDDSYCSRAVRKEK